LLIFKNKKTRRTNIMSAKTKTSRLPWHACDDAALLDEVYKLGRDEQHLFMMIYHRTFALDGPIGDTARQLSNITKIPHKAVEEALKGLIEDGMIAVTPAGKIDCGFTHKELAERSERVEKKAKQTSGAGKASALKRAEQKRLAGEKAEKSAEKIQQNQRNAPTVVERSLDNRAGGNVVDFLSTKKNAEKTQQKQRNEATTVERPSTHIHEQGHSESGGIYNEAYETGGARYDLSDFERYGVDECNGLFAPPEEPDDFSAAEFFAERRNVGFNAGHQHRDYFESVELKKCVGSEQTITFPINIRKSSSCSLGSAKKARKPKQSAKSKNADNNNINFADDSTLIGILTTRLSESTARAYIDFRKVGFHGMSYFTMEDAEDLISALEDYADPENHMNRFLADRGFL